MKILFVCTGNLCRSPLAAAIARRLAPAHEFRSAGTHAWNGGPATEHAVEVAGEHGLDLADHRSRRLDPADVAWADRILVMEPSHLAALNGNAGLLCDKGIEDPYGQGIEVYRECFKELESAIRARLEEWEP